MKKQELKQPDQVQVAIEQGLVEINKNRGPIAIALGVIVLAVVAVSSFQRQGELDLERLNQRFLHASDAVSRARDLSKGPERARKIAEADKKLEALYDDTIGEDLQPFVLAKRADLKASEGDYIAAIGLTLELIEISKAPEMKIAAYYRLMKLYISLRK